MNFQGRGSASINIVQVVAVLLCLMVVQLECIYAASYTVGDSRGWSFNTDKWPSGKQFRAGDVLSKLICHLTHIAESYVRT